MPAKRYCFIVGCHNNEQNNRELTFYSFPHRNYEIDRKNKWIQAVKRTTSDKKSWLPNKNSRICSAYFIGGQKSNIQNDPAYLPTIFPSQYQKKIMSVAVVGRHKRLQVRKERAHALQKQDHENIGKEVEMGSNEIDNHVESMSIGCQTDIYDCEEEHTSQPNILFCCNHGENESSTQTNICIEKPKKNQGHVVKDLKYFKTTSCGPETVINYGFSGFADIKTNETMLQLGGVSLEFLHVLLKLINLKADGQPAYYKVLDKENRLLVFLMKMKLRVSFCALACLFNIHATTASRIFVEILSTLTQKTKTWIFWPTKESIKRNLPFAFTKYPNCRCIIDCTEIFTETPPTVEQRVLMYSNYKSRFSVKYLIVITPDGFVCRISKGYGGRATDSYITNDSGFLQLIEPGDTVLADKGFPQIRSELMKREAILIIPPFAFDPQFSDQDVEETYKIASVRIHVERAIQRIKVCNILNLIPVELLPYVDSIMHMCCIIANSKPPLIKSNDD